MRAMESASSTPLQLSVSVVVYNSAPALLRHTLTTLNRAVEEVHSQGIGRVTVDVVDNASDPGYRSQVEEMVSTWPPSEAMELRFKSLTSNRGFGAGHNVVISTLASDYHLILNPDVELAESALSLGLERLQAERDITLLSPRVQGESGRQEFLCKRYPSVLVLFLRAFAPAFLRRIFARKLTDYQMKDVCAGETPVDVPLASGCCMLVRSADLKAVNGFDERYFLYFEDFDLSLRLASRGRLLFDPAMRIVHHGGYAARKGLAHVKYFLRSGTRFFSQHGWRWI